METLSSWIAWADSFIWGPPLLVLLLGTHIFYTIRLRFVQRHLIKAFGIIIKRKEDSQGNISPVSALAVAMASTIGTGNIIGVATAITMGGPGAVFWCLMTGIFGMSTKYAESLLAVKYRGKDSQGEVHGGPMYTIYNGLGMRWLAILFSITGAIAVIGTGDLVQSNAIAAIVNRTFSVPSWITGLAVAIVIALVVIGGLKSIASVCTKLVPLMSTIYLLGCFTLLIINVKVLPEAIAVIVKSAFSAKAVTGGLAGYGLMLAARYGIARGLFSNEAGMGSEPIVAATAQARNAVRQGLVSYTGTACTIVICALTGLVIVSSAIANDSIDIANNQLLTQAAFEEIPYCGKYILAFSIFAFAITTVLGWCYYGEQCVLFICKKKAAIIGYRVLFVIAAFLGSIGSIAIVWDFSDLANGFMVFPNIVSLLFLSNKVVEETRKYLWSEHLYDLDPDCQDIKYKIQDS
ncbi:MAG: sodium:alanine symporter family protein [Victivallales bacterium]|nr:sodium:alanine symporter family protein [Victivallales bacterium]